MYHQGVKLTIPRSGTTWQNDGPDLDLDKDKDKEALFNVAYSVTDNISSWAILRHNNYIFNRYLPVFISLAQPLYASVSKGAASTIFYTFGMVRPRDSNPRPPAPKADALPTELSEFQPFAKVISRRQKFCPFALETPKRVFRRTAKTQTNISSKITTGDPSIYTMENPVLTVSTVCVCVCACVLVCVCVFRKFLELKGLNSCCPC